MPTTPHAKAGQYTVVDPSVVSQSFRARKLHFPAPIICLSLLLTSAKERPTTSILATPQSFCRIIVLPHYGIIPKEHNHIGLPQSFPPHIAFGNMALICVVNQQGWWSRYYAAYSSCLFMALYQKGTTILAFLCTFTFMNIINNISLKRGQIIMPALKKALSTNKLRLRIFIFYFFVSHKFIKKVLPSQAKFKSNHCFLFFKN
jgi:hypothetical protein